ncbi:unnamed protein product, partial [Brugia timori]
MSKFVTSDGLATFGTIGAFKVLDLKPSQSKPINHLCLRISPTPPLPQPRRSPGLSLQSFL